MCIFSTFVEADNRRNARVGETLTVGSYRSHACLMGDDGKVTCIKHGTTLTIDKASFDLSALAPVYAKALRKLAGKTLTVVLRRPAHGYSADRFDLAMPKGPAVVVTFGWLAPGLTMRIARKVRKDKGVAKPRNLTKVLGLDQIKADIPVDKKVDA